MIWIFGDSFAASPDPESWSQRINNTKNLSSNGSSEYRIYKNYINAKSQINENDLVLFVHTSPSRVYLKNDKHLSSRNLPTHQHCDIILNDVFEKKEQEYTKLLETIWDEDYFVDTYNLVVDSLLKVPNSRHITFFQIARNDIVNLNSVWLANQGDINHMNQQGNRLAYDIILQLIR